MPPLRIDSPLSAVPGLKRHVDALARHGCRTVEDVLWRLPFRYEDRSRTATLSDLGEGEVASSRVRVRRVRIVPTRRPGFSVLDVEVSDSSGTLRALFFNQAYLTQQLTPGTEIYLCGPAVRNGLFLELRNPEVEVVRPETTPVHTCRIVPVYERLGRFGPRAHRSIVRQLLDQIELVETLPEKLVSAERLSSIRSALEEAHFPTTLQDGAGAGPGAARRRLAFEELFGEQLGLQVLRRTRREAGAATPLALATEMRERLGEALSFRLTSAQRRVFQEIAADLAGVRPMRRLLQGDVGSGKTVIAALTMAVAALQGQQAALMAPTELLAEQHGASLGRFFGSLGLRPGLLVGGLPSKERKALLGALADGSLSVIIGTHALIQKGVRFKNLAVAVIDEQHRFGVGQREGLDAKGIAPHLLVMTATPIPRSLALTAYGDLDLSVIDELPPGRTPIRTLLKVGSSEAEVYGFLRRKIDEGRQAYVVCPLVEESERVDLKAAEEWAEHIASKYLKGCSVGLVHGRMNSQDRGQLMAGFAAGEIQALVGTTVLEVGIDVANATVMVIEHAERFGLSQLHQLRGRIGRGRDSGTCFLVVRDRISDSARRRLEIVRATRDGFRMAEQDLVLRGPGDLFGTRQWGVPSFRVVDLPRDAELLEPARAAAMQYVEDVGWMASPQATRLMDGFHARRGTGGGGREEMAATTERLDHARHRR